MKVQRLQDDNKSEWDAYVSESAQATFFHLSGWKDVMEGTHGLQAPFLFAKECGQIVGVLPLFHIKSRLGGHYFTSMPGALCAQDENAAQALIERAKELVKASGARYLVLRDSHANRKLPELVTNKDHCTLVVKLSDDPDEVWQRIKRRARQLTNKAKRAKVTVKIGPNSMEDFYPVYARAMRDVGTPTPGVRFFRNVLAQFPGHFNLVTVRHRHDLLGGVTIASYKDSIYCLWGGMLRQFYDLYPNHLLYWETLRFGCANGLQWVDLGRSQWDSGTYTFKMNWGAEPRPLYQKFFLNGASRPPAVGNSMKGDAKYRLFFGVWKRLPLTATETLGPWLRKRMPFG